MAHKNISHDHTSKHGTKKHAPQPHQSGHGTHKYILWSHQSKHGTLKYISSLHQSKHGSQKYIPWSTNLNMAHINISLHHTSLNAAHRNIQDYFMISWERINSIYPPHHISPDICSRGTHTQTHPFTKTSFLNWHHHADSWRGWKHQPTN